jgi:hypothetical protein
MSKPTTVVVFNHIELEEAFNSIIERL